ncbi:MAG: hypothetical protein ACRC10_08975 [Thermoguttaceae bacterium]
MSESFFRFAKIDGLRDCFFPLIVLGLLGYWFYRQYTKECIDLGVWPFRCLLTLRLAFLLVLLLFYLEPTFESLQSFSRIAVLIDTSGSMTRMDREREGADVVPRLQEVRDWLEKNDFLGQLGQNHDWSFYCFDRDLNRLGLTEREDEMKGGPDWERLRADGVETRLGEIMEELLQREKDNMLTGVVLISDGGHNAGLEPEKVLERFQTFQIPVQVVGVGSTEQPIDLKFTAIEVPERAFLSDPFSVKCFVELQGANQQTTNQQGLNQQELSVESQHCTVEVWMLEEGGIPGLNSEALEKRRQIGTKELTLESGDLCEVAFEVNPKTTGKYRIEFKLMTELEPEKGEDHFQNGVVEIVDRQDRILLFAGGPTRDYQFLSSQLFRDHSAEVDAYLPWAGEDVSQSVHKRILEFPKTANEMSQYDAVVAFDPDWRNLSSEQISILENWVMQEGGGLVVVAGPVHLMDTISGWTTDTKMERVLALYPVDVSSQKASSSLLFQGEKQPQDISWTEQGKAAEFLRPADSELESRAIWSHFPGFYSRYVVNGLKPGTILYAQTGLLNLTGISTPTGDSNTIGVSNSAEASQSTTPIMTGEEQLLSRDTSRETGQMNVGQSKEGDPFLSKRPQSVLFAEQFYGSGRVFYIGCSELWRLRKTGDSCFDKLYTRIIRHTSQGRLYRRTEGIQLTTDKKRYVLGETAIFRLVVKNSQNVDSLRTTDVFAEQSLEVLDPDLQVQRIQFLADSTFPGTFSAVLPLTKEGVWSLKRPISGSEESVSETIEVRLSDKEQEQTCQNVTLLKKIAAQTGGRYYNLVQTDGATDLLEQLNVYTQKTLIDKESQKKFQLLFLFLLCTLLCTEWLLRRLFHLM